METKLNISCSYNSYQGDYQVTLTIFDRLRHSTRIKEKPSPRTKNETSRNQSRASKNETKNKTNPRGTLIQVGDDEYKNYIIGEANIHEKKKVRESTKHG